MDIIPIPGSAVPCERVFSSAKETMTPRRNRISPDLMEALQVLKFSSKHGNSVLSFTSGESWADEEKNLMKLMEENGTVPEDIREYEKRIGASKASKASTSTPSGSKRRSLFKKV